MIKLLLKPETMFNKTLKVKSYFFTFQLNLKITEHQKHIPVFLDASPKPG